MKCRFCGSGIEESWKFCPKCGSIQRDMFRNLDEIVNKMKREMKSMDSVFDKHAEVFDMSNAFRNMDRRVQIRPGPNSSGFTVRISRSGNNPPKMSVRTFGNVDNEKLMKRVQGKFGIKPRTVQRTREQPIPVGGELKTPKSTEEPKSIIKRLMHKISVDVELPKITDLKDVQIKELQNSVEIKAVAGDHGYFKIITKPENFSLTKKELKNGILSLEFS